MWRKFILWFMETRAYRWFLINVLPFIRFTTYYTSMRGWKMHRGYKRVRPGDMIVTVDKKKASTRIIPGTFSHAGLCVSKNTEFETAEMTHSDYTCSTFADMCFEADRVVILRCTDWDEDYCKEVIKKCLSFMGAQYDVEFSLGISALYCSELIWHSDIEKRLQVSLGDLVGIGRPYLSPDGLFKAKNVEVVWDSDNETKPTAAELAATVVTI